MWLNYIIKAYYPFREIPFEPEVSIQNFQQIMNIIKTIEFYLPVSYEMSLASHIVPHPVSKCIN